MTRVRHELAFRNEAALQSAALLALCDSGAFVENRVPSFFGERGVPDITGVFLGLGFAIELKNPRHHGPPGKDDTRWPAQRKYLQRVNMAGGFALATNKYGAVLDLLQRMQKYALREGGRIDRYVEEWT